MIHIRSQYLTITTAQSEGPHGAAINKKMKQCSDNGNMLVFPFFCLWLSFCLDLSFHGWYQRNYKWHTHGSERLDLNHISHLWTQQLRDVQIMENYWMLRWDVSNALYVITCYFDDDTKLIYYDRNIVMSVLIWSIIIIYEHNNDGALWWIIAWKRTKSGEKKYYERIR